MFNNQRLILTRVFVTPTLFAQNVERWHLGNSVLQRRRSFNRWDFPALDTVNGSPNRLQPTSVWVVGGLTGTAAESSPPGKTDAEKNQD